MKKKILVLLLLTITILITLGGTSDTEAARICSNCQAGNHASCPYAKYTYDSTYHSVWCCCGKTFATAVPHDILKFLNNSTYCYVCVCGYKETHNTKGGHCNKPHCQYNSSKTLCDRKCNHTKWTSCRDHSYSSSWSRSTTHHWKKCVVSTSCTAKIDYGAHEDKNNDGKCDKCEVNNSSGGQAGQGGGAADETVTSSMPGNPVITVGNKNFNGTAESNVIYTNSNVDWKIETLDSISHRPLRMTEYELAGATTGSSAISRAVRYNKTGTYFRALNWTNQTIPSSHTIEFWIYIPTNHEGTSYMFHTSYVQYAKRNNQLHLYDKGQMILRSSQSGAPSTGTNYITKDDLLSLGFYNGWSYVSVQVEAEKTFAAGVQIWINGKKANMTLNSATAYKTEKLLKDLIFVGGYYKYTNAGLPEGSMMKELKIMSGLLASSSSSRMYNKMVSGVTGYDALLAYYPMEETSGSTAYTGMASNGVNGVYTTNPDESYTARDVSQYYSGLPIDSNSKFSGTITAEGRTRITANHVGMNGATAGSTVDVVIDKTAPTGKISSSVYNTNQNSVTLYVTAEDTSGISAVTVNGWYGGNWSQYNSSKSATYNNKTGQWEVTYYFSEIQNTTTGATNQGQGIYYFDAHIYDNAGNWGIASLVTVAYDTEGPTKGPVTVDGATGSYPTFYTSNVTSTVTINFTGIADNLSGISNFDYYLRRDGAARVYDYNAGQAVDENAGTGYVKYTLNGQGRYVTEIYLYDRAGNLSAYEEITIIADNEAPSLPSESVEGATLKDDGKYYVTDSTGVVTINSWNMSDNLSGLSNFDYYLRKDGASRTYAYNVAQAVDPSTGTGYVKYKFNGYGTYTTERYIYDKAGNHRPCEVKTFVVAPDKSQGVIYTSASVTNQPTITVSVAASDESSGVANVTIYGWQGTTVSGTAGAFIGGNSTYNSSTGRWEKAFTFSELPSRETGNTNQGDGIYSFDAHVINNAGTDTYIDLVSVTYDITPPKITSITYDPGWKNTSVTEEVSATDNLSGVRIIEYSYDLNSWYSDWDVTGTGYAKATWTAEGDRVLYFRATDYAGNTWVYAFDGVHPSAYDLKIDKTLPNGTVSASTTCTNQNSVTIYVNATDALSGVDHVKIMAWTGSKDWVKTNAERDTTYNTETGLWEITFTFDEIRDTTTGELNQGDGNYYFGAHIYDKAGNRRIVDGTTVIYDTTPPKITSITYDPGWKNVDITKGVEAVDALSGIKLIEYSYDLNTWYSDWEISNKGYVRRTWTEEGDRVVYFRATDNAGNIWVYAFDGTHPSAYDLKIDKTSPVAGTYTVSGATFSDGKYYVTNNTAEITLNFTGMSDNLSGLKNFDYYLRKDGAERTYDYNVEQSITGSTGYVKYKLNGEGTYVTEIYLYDNATNLVGYDSITIVADNTPPTITSITYDPGWKNVDITKYVEATDNLSGVKLLEYSYDLNTWYSDWDSSSGGYANKTWTEEGDRVVYFRATDYAENIGVYAYDGVNPTAYDLKIDKTIPEIGTYTVSGTTVVGGKHYVTNENAEITLNFTGMSDNLSGLKNFDYYLRKDGAERTYDYNVEQNITGSTGYVKYKLNGYGTYTTEIYLYDNATNHRGYQILTINAVESIPIARLMERESYEYVSGKDVYYAIGAKRSNNKKYTSDLINSITFVNNVNVPNEAEASWDASYTNGDNKVIAWVIPNTTDSTKYDLYIGADDITIVASANSYNLFGKYKNCTAINNLTMLDTSSVTDMDYMFSDCRSLPSLDVSNFNTSNVTNMSDMFSNCGSLPSLDVSNFDTSNVTDMGYMFSDCSSLPSLDVSNFNTSNVTDMSSMFFGCSSLTSLDVSNFNTSNVTNMRSMFSYCSSLPSLDVSNFNTSNVTDMSSMFYICSSLPSLAVSNFNTSNVTNMNSMFSSCSSLPSLDVSNFNTSNVTNMSYMFDDCSSLASLDVSNFDTSQVKSMGFMFNKCSSLPSLDLRNFNTISLDGKTWGSSSSTLGVDVNYMFGGCSNLESMILGNNFNRLDGYNMFKGCSNLKAIITIKEITSSGDAPTLSGTENVTNENGKIIAGPNGLIDLPNAILYVPNTTSETAYEAATNYSTVFGADRIRPILELVGDNPAKVSKGATYVDAGVTVAGMTKNADGTTYTPYGYTVSGPVIKKDGTVVSNIDTNTKGTYTYTYTIKDSSNVEGMSVTRDVIVKDNPRLMQREHDNNYQYYAIGAYRADNSTIYTADKIKKITLIDLSKESAPTTYVATWDASYTNGDGDVTAWLVTNAEDSTMYDLYIGADDITIVAPANSYNLFGEYKNCTAINNLTMLDTSNVTSMGSMFYYCSSLTSLDVSNFDTSKVTNMSSMFSRCSSLPSLDVSNFDTSQVTNMSSMFSRCSSLTSLAVSNFNTSNVINMGGMFLGCSSLPSLAVSNFDTSNVTNMDAMFYNCSSLPSLDVSNFNTSNVTNMGSMFYNCSSLPSLDLSKFNTSNVTNMSGMFSDCSSLSSLDVSKFDTAKVTSMRSMFSGCIILPSLDVSKFNTSKVTNMGNMFYNCRGLPSLDVSNFNTSNVINMVGMFSVCISLPSLDVSNFNTSNVTNMNSMFSYCSSLPSLDVSNFNTSNVTNMNSMFSYCSSLPSLDVSNFNTSNVTNMVSMFSTCSSLASLDVSSFDTSNVTNMYRMFYGCSSLPSLDVSSFDTSNVTNMDSMFYGCSSLTSINLGTSFDKLIGADMFKYCSKLKAIITPRANSMTLNDNATTSTGLKTLTNAILYVPSIDAEATFEAVANYADILGADRIRPILELLGDNPVKVSKGATYVDSGVTVAGMTKNADGLAYTPYGYTVSGPVIKKDGTVVSSVDTSNVGTYTLTYTVHEPNSSLDGMSVIREVEIESKDISENNPDITVSIPTEDRVYRDAAYTPVVTVKDGTTTLVEGTDYSVSYSDNINAGMATVTIKGINNYTGTRTENFMITQRPVTIKPKDAIKEYDTLPLTSNEPEVTAGSLVDGHTATITTNGSITSVESITNTISTLTIENASGTDVTANYNVTKAVGTLTVTAVDNVDFDIILDNNSFVYDGTEKEPGVTIKVNGVTLEEGKDYDVSYKNNKDAGTATVTITGKGNYEGSSSTKDFTITKRPLEITAGSASKVYNGTALTSSTFSITSGTSLAPNQTLSVTTSGTITNVGTTSNVIATYTIYQNGENVTANYSVTLKEGILEVKPATITGSVIITGTNRVGKTLTVEVTVNPNDASLTYVWYYGTTNDINNATVITGANAKTYSPTTDKIGMYIFVKVTASKENYNDATFTDITDNENNKVEKVGDRLTPYLMAREVQTVTSNGVTSEKAGYAIGAYRAGKTKYTSDLIKSVTIINLLETNAPTTYEAMWDASRDEDEAVFVWAVKNQTNSSMYDLYIGGEGTLVLTNGKRLFADYTKCDNITGLNKMNSTNVTDMSYMFSNLASMSALDVSVVNTSSVTNMEGMFMTNNLTNLNVSGFDTSKVTNMSKMFKESSNLTSLNINGFNTANTNNMSQMFMDCGNITSLNVSAFNTSNVTNMSAMFMGMSKIETLNVTNFNTVNVTDMSSMFASCLKVQRLDLHTFNTTKVTNISGMFTAASSMKSVLLGEEFNKLNGSNMFTGCSSLKAIIAQKKITASSEAMTLSATGTGLNTLTNATLYVPNLESKGYYETATNYATVFGEARVKPILEIIGANPVYVTVGKEYVDQGAKVAGFEESEATEYTVYGYTLSVSGLPVDTSTVGTKLVIYTVKYKDQVVVTGATW